MDGLLHPRRFSSLKRAHINVGNTPLALPLYGRAGDTEAWQGLPVIKHVWEIFVVKWEHRTPLQIVLNYIELLGCHALTVLNIN